MPDLSNAARDDALQTLLQARFSESASKQARNYLVVGGVLACHAHATADTLTLEADVQRSAQRRYHVSVEYLDTGECTLQCSCPFATMACEHAAAVILAWLEQRQLFRTHRSRAMQPAPVVGGRPLAAAAQSATTPLAAATPAVATSLVRLSEDMRLTLRQAPAAVVSLAEQLGQVVSSSDQETIYLLIEDRLQQALRSDWQMKDILTLLTEAAGGPLLPEAVARLWKWAQQPSDLHLYNQLAVIEFADDYTLQELLRAGGMRRYFLHIFSPRLVAVQPGSVAELAAEMVKRGFMPTFE